MLTRYPLVAVVLTEAKALREDGHLERSHKLEQAGKLLEMYLEADQGARTVIDVPPLELEEIE